MTLCLLLIGDGRDDVHERSWESAQLSLGGADQVVKVDDRDHELGFAGAIQRGWEQVETDYVFHLEADFVFNRPLDTARMVAVLEEHPHLAQLVLKRQPWNQQEKAAGGIVECWPDEYVQRTWRGNVWTEHRLFWSTNPSLYSSAWCEQGWPQAEHSEEAWTDRLTEDSDLRFAFVGAKFDPPLCEHIGAERAGHGY